MTAIDVAFEIVMSPGWTPAPVVVIVTLVPAFSVAAIVESFTLALLPLGVKTSGLPPLNAPLLVLFWIVTS